MRVPTRRSVLLTNAATTTLGFTRLGVFFLLPYLLGSHTGASWPDTPIFEGLLLLPIAIGHLAAGPPSARIAQAITDRWAFALGLALTSTGSLGLAIAHTAALGIALWGFVPGVGTGLGIAVGSAIVSRTATDADTGVATATHSVLRRVGGGIGSQLCAAPPRRSRIINPRRAAAVGKHIGTHGVRQRLNATSPVPTAPEDGCEQLACATRTAR